MNFRRKDRVLRFKACGCDDMSSAHQPPSELQEPPPKSRASRTDLATFVIPSQIRSRIYYVILLHHTIHYYIPLYLPLPYYTSRCSSILHYTLVYCAIPNGAILYYAILYYALLYYIIHLTLRYYSVVYSTLLDSNRSTVLYYTIGCARLCPTSQPRPTRSICNWDAATAFCINSLACRQKPSQHFLRWRPCFSNTWAVESVMNVSSTGSSKRSRHLVRILVPCEDFRTFYGNGNFKARGLCAVR